MLLSQVVCNKGRNDKTDEQFNAVRGGATVTNYDQFSSSSDDVTCRLHKHSFQLHSQSGTELTDGRTDGWVDGWVICLNETVG